MRRGCSESLRSDATVASITTRVDNRCMTTLGRFGEEPFSFALLKRRAQHGGEGEHDLDTLIPNRVMRDMAGREIIREPCFHGLRCSPR
jgi:hypothetical protein